MGAQHLSKGFMCSAWGSDLGFEECNSNKCKVGTMNGCAVSELKKLTTSDIDVDEQEISGTESFQGCQKSEGIFKPLSSYNMNGNFII